MEKKIYTVAIIGVGARGGETYGRLMMNFPDRFKIVSICDLKKERRDLFGNEFHVDESLRFEDEDEFFKEKRADLCIVATLDKDHVRHCLKAFNVGYDVMTEKPLSDSKEECEQLLQAQKKSGRKALVCHVLRYAPAFVKVAELLDQGTIGRLVAINALERVAYWHQAHSYVRGNWRRSEETTPMILAKCCHDLDLIQYYAKSKCNSVSSVGDLTYYKSENAPEGATARCVDCPHKETCEYSAVTFYNNNWKWNNYAASCWPAGVLVDQPITQEKLDKAIAEGPYGRCVFHCDNNVVDHQFTQMSFANGVKASLLMTAFTADGGRRMHFVGTKGELTLEEAENCIYVHKFGQAEEKIDTRHLSDNGYGHGGGDLCLVETLYAMLEGTAECATSLDASVESHLIGICAEESRLQGGKLIRVHE